MEGVNRNTRLVEITMLLSRRHLFKYATFLISLADHFCQHCHWESSGHDRLTSQGGGEGWWWGGGAGSEERGGQGVAIMGEMSILMT